MSTNVSPLEALKGGFRKACVKRLVGDEEGAVEVLRNEIPLLVVAWAKTTSIEPAEKKAKLKEFFDDESTRADELAVAFDLFAGRFEARVASRVEESVGLVSEKLSLLTDRLESAINMLTQSDSPLLSQVSDELSLKSNVEPIKVSELAGVIQDNVNEKKKDMEELDPPRSTGLVFDDIEGMIDELLASEK
jgi:hypothetical protein